MNTYNEYKNGTFRHCHSESECNNHAKIQQKANIVMCIII
jgi:hypothetical protein